MNNLALDAVLLGHRLGRAVVVNDFFEVQHLMVCWEMKERPLRVLSLWFYRYVLVSNVSIYVFKPIVGQQVPGRVISSVYALQSVVACGTSPDTYHVSSVSGIVVMNHVTLSAHCHERIHMYSGPLLTEYLYTRNTMDTDTGSNNKSTGWRTVGCIVGAVLTPAAVVVATPIVAGALGFGATGIVAGSTATSMMSVLGGGATAAGGVVATLQSAGATGTIAFSAMTTAAMATAGGLLGAAIGGSIPKGKQIRVSYDDGRVAGHFKTFQDAVDLLSLTTAEIEQVKETGTCRKFKFEVVDA